MKTCHRGNILLELVLLGIKTEGIRSRHSPGFYVFYGSGICLNVESIVFVLCVEDTPVIECKTERVGDGGCPSES